MSRGILIAGVGNIFMGDDAFGYEVTKRLAQRPTAPGVRVVDFGIRGMDFVFALTDEYDATIIVDATKRGGKPGTIYLIDPDLNELDDFTPSVEAHSMDPMRALALARSMGATLKNIRIVGCEPETFEPADDGQLRLSPDVFAAVDHAVEVIASLVRAVDERSCDGREPALKEEARI